MIKTLEEEIIDEIIRNDGRAALSRRGPCCAFLQEEPWPAWVPALACHTPDEAPGLLGSGWDELLLAAGATVPTELCYLGTRVVGGTATGLVVATGRRTFLTKS